MIFGIKTRKELKKEIEELKDQLAAASLEKPIYHKVVCEHFPLETLSTELSISYHNMNNLPHDYIMDTLESNISHGLRNYMDIETSHDLINSAYRIGGTLTVVVPRRKEVE